MSTDVDRIIYEIRNLSHKEGFESMRRSPSSFVLYLSDIGKNHDLPIPLDPVSGILKNRCQAIQFIQGFNGSGGLNVGFADGQVIAIPSSTSADEVRKLFNCSDGAPILPR